MALKDYLKMPLQSLLEIPEQSIGPSRYKIIRRNISILMLFVTIAPLVLMAGINYHEYQSALIEEIVTPLRILVNKTKHSFELFMTGRLATVRFIATAYPFSDLIDEKKLGRIFKSLRQEFDGFIDIGIIDSNGHQVSYAGPYDLKNKNYADQAWFQQVRLNGVYISEVFMGYRKFPHVVIAVQHLNDDGDYWILRATIDTKRFDELIAAMGLDPQSDAFLINREGILQTASKFYGGVLDSCTDCVPPVSYEPAVLEKTDPKGREVLVTYAFLNRPDFILMLIKPRTEILKSWYTFKTELFLVFLASVVIIVLAVLRLTHILVERLKKADDRRELALREVEHTQKLSSIGRLAAGVAHEINNPMAVINEKAGLMKDLIELNDAFPDKERFINLLLAITQSVDRCRTITHRLLGFARRMEVEIEVLDLNDIIRETLGFLEKEAMHRNININLSLGEDLPRIASDRGQLQQVFLNLINNAFAAVKDSGMISVATWDKDIDTIGITVQDNGVGMSQETLKHIFEPFFTTKKGTGTGLGLSITYGIVKKLGGEIEVKSKLGEGTQFIIFLPKKSKEDRGA
jgi:two-component system, NtrC family, sensor kinase